MKRLNEPIVTGSLIPLSEVTPRDRVTILTPHGSILTGKAVMPCSTGGWVLNLGGPHGTPGIANHSNFVRARRSK